MKNNQRPKNIKKKERKNPKGKQKIIKYLTAIKKEKKEKKNYCVSK